jgi:hypothetical protein
MSLFNFIFIQNNPSKSKALCNTVQNRTGPTALFASYWALKAVIQKKGKAFPLQACSGPDGSRKLRFPDFMTTAQDGGRVVSLTHRPPLPTGNTPGIHFCWRLSPP